MTDLVVANLQGVAGASPSPHWASIVTKTRLAEWGINDDLSDWRLRFWGAVARAPVDDGGCWLWLGHVDNKGYGRFHCGGVLHLAHRIAVTQQYGPIPLDAVADHMCDTKSCVNPEHIALVTHTENSLRSSSPWAENARKDTCPQGHPYSHKDERGSRRCSTCQREQATRFREANRDAINQRQRELRAAQR